MVSLQGSAAATRVSLETAFGSTWRLQPARQRRGRGGHDPVHLRIGGFANQ
jgi:hypothetical protein